MNNMLIGALTFVLVAVLGSATAPTQWWHIISRLFFLPIVFIGARFGMIAGTGAGAAIAILCTFAAAQETAGKTWFSVLYSDFAIAGLAAGVLQRQWRRRAQPQIWGDVDPWLRVGRMQGSTQIDQVTLDRTLNPLASIEGAATLLADPGTTERVRQELVTIIRSECGYLSERLVNLLQRDRDFAAPSFVPSNFGEIVEAAIQQVEFALCETGASLSKDVPPDLPPIECNPGQIRNALAGLTIRSLQSVPAGSTVVLRARHQEGSLFVDIKEAGSRPFRIGLLAPARGSSNPLITPQGLAMIHAIVNGHGGRIEAKLNTRKGLEFTVQLPLRRSRADDDWQSTGSRGRHQSPASDSASS